MSEREIKTSEEKEIDIYKKIEKYYTAKGESLSYLREDNSTECYRDDLLHKFSIDMLAARNIDAERIEELNCDLVFSKSSNERLLEKIAQLESDVRYLLQFIPNWETPDRAEQIHQRQQGGIK
jgi:hypothetical protein